MTSFETVPVDGAAIADPVLSPLYSPQLSVKYFVANPSVVNVEDLIPVFHRWIQDGLVDDELMIDVANYSHLHEGPGVLLICDTAHIALDMKGGRPGVLYTKKRRADGDSQARLARVFRSGLRAAKKLEDEVMLGGRYRFRTDEIEFSILDRLQAPNTFDTFVTIHPELRSFVSKLYEDDEVSIEHSARPKEAFSVRIFASRAPLIDDLLARLG